VAASKQDERYYFVPRALRGKFPNTWILMLEKNMRIVLEMNLLVLSFLILYATMVGPPHRSEWIYLLTAGIGPEAVAAWYIIFPMNPYRSMTAIREGMRGKDKIDPDAKELVALLKSASLHKTPIWRFGADCFVRIPAFLLLCLFILFRMELLAWALRNWTSWTGKYQTG